MNTSNPFFLMFLLEFYQRTELKPIETIIYSMMFNKYRYYKKQHIEYSPSVNHLAREAKCSELTVKHALQTLKTMRLITVLKRGNGITGKASTYTVQDYREIENIFTRPGTSELNAADRAAREAPTEQEQPESEALPTEIPVAESEAETPATETEPTEQPVEASEPIASAIHSDSPERLSERDTGRNRAIPQS